LPVPSERRPFVSLLDEFAFEFLNGKVRAAHEVHQSLFARSYMFDRAFYAVERGLWNSQQTVLVTVQQITRFDFQSQNLNRHANAHDLEICVAGDCAAREVMKAKRPHFRNITHPTVGHEPNRAQSRES